MKIYLVATPIGNLEDLSPRAQRILSEVELIAAEDTRHTKKLLSHFNISTPLTSYHSHTSDKKIQALLDQGQDIALVSDAGTPGISDPAWTFIQAALERELEIIPIPGPAAFLTALMASGLPMDKFDYRGFIPAKKGRQTLFESLQNSKHTTIFYESPHRLVKSLAQLQDALGPDRHVVIARELTKLHEEFLRGPLSQLNEHFATEKPRGEFVLLIAPANF